LQMKSAKRATASCLTGARGRERRGATYSLMRRKRKSFDELNGKKGKRVRRRPSHRKRRKGGTVFRGFELQGRGERWRRKSKKRKKAFGSKRRKVVSQLKRKRKRKGGKGERGEFLKVRGEQSRVPPLAGREKCLPG